MQGWLGNGESGIVVLDNLNVTQTRVDGAVQAVNIHPGHGQGHQTASEKEPMGGGVNVQKLVQI